MTKWRKLHHKIHPSKLDHKTLLNTWLWFKVLQIDLILVLSDVLMSSHHYNGKLELRRHIQSLLDIVLTYSRLNWALHNTTTSDSSTVVSMVPSQILSPEFPACFGSSSSPLGMTRPENEPKDKVNIIEQDHFQWSTGAQSYFPWHETRILYRCKLCCSLQMWMLRFCWVSDRWPSLKCCSTDIQIAPLSTDVKPWAVTLDCCLKSYL